MNNHSHKNQVLFYMGGFSPTGGIETFCKNLLSYFQLNGYSSQLVCWGILSPLISALKEQSIVVRRNFWRWGCKWNLPDWLLLPIGIQAVKQANVVILNKLFPYAILKILRSQAKPKTKFIYITPYKPEAPTSPQEKQDISKSLNIFDVILVQSNSFVKNLQDSDYKGKIEVVPLITSLKGTIKPLLSKKTLQIGFLGRLVQDKNVSLLLEAFAYLKKNSHNNMPITLNLFGDGYLRKNLEELACGLGIEKFVVFHGNISNNQVSDAIASCHLFVFTSINEGQCLAALEILSSGRPLVATDAGALPEILSDSRLGRLVEFTPESIAMGILEVANLLRHDIMTPENICSAYLERFNPEKVGHRYIEIINSLE
jgi:glycosyltransferase involved in cell wall biosynthesis